MIVCVSMPLSTKNRNVVTGSGLPCMMTLLHTVVLSSHFFPLMLHFCPHTHSFTFSTRIALSPLQLSEYWVYRYLEASLAGDGTMNGSDITQLKSEFCIHTTLGEKLSLNMLILSARKKKIHVHNSLLILFVKAFKILKEASLPC